MPGTAKQCLLQKKKNISNVLDALHSSIRSQGKGKALANLEQIPPKE